MPVRTNLSNTVVTLLQIRGFMLICTNILLLINKTPNRSRRRFQWPRGLRRKSAATRLLRLWFRIPPGAWVFFIASVVCCQVEVPATS
jgi:hypothetical protein